MSKYSPQKSKRDLKAATGIKAVYAVTINLVLDLLLVFDKDCLNGLTASGEKVNQQSLNQKLYRRQ